MSISIDKDRSTQHLYRHYCAEGGLLYVGISLSAINRLGQHKDHSHWFSKISRVEIESFASRAEVISAERLAISKENPLYNIQRYKLKEEKTKYQDAKDDLIKRVIQFNVTYSVDGIASALGIRPSQVLKEIEQGRLSCIEIDGWVKSNIPNPKKIIKITGWQLIDYIEQLDNKARKVKHDRSSNY